MGKKRYYGENGKQVRSRPAKRFYQKGSVWLVVGFLAIIVMIATATFTGKEKMVNEPTASETAEVEDEEGEAIEEEDEPTEKEVEAQVYTYGDFQGTYIKFAVDPYESGIASLYIFENDSFRYLNLWDKDLKSIITNTTIEGSVLTLDFYGEPNEKWGDYDESGTEQFELRQEGDQTFLYSITNGYSLYSISAEDLQHHYTQAEIDYARIVMTVIGGNIPLDWWAVHSPVTMHVSHSSAGEPLGGWGGAPSYPEDVIHLSSDQLASLSHLSDLLDDGSITYSPHGDGNITLYQLNKEGAEKVSQEKIEEVGTVYVDPSEPYLVADFIGRVEFVYE